MALDKFKNFLSGKDDSVNDSDEEYYNEEVATDSENKMILLEPRAYSESQQIADYLKNRSAVVVNLKRVTPDQAKRIVDYIAANGNIDDNKVLMGEPFKSVGSITTLFKDDMGTAKQIMEVVAQIKRNSEEIA